MTRGLHRSWQLALLASLVLLLTACAGAGTATPDRRGIDGEPTEDASPSVDPTDTVLAVTPTGEAEPALAEVGVTDTLEGTWDAFLRDSVAVAARRMQDRVYFESLYQRPDLVIANGGGVMADVDLVEDRTEFELSNSDTLGSSNVEYDVRVSFVNGNSSLLTCRYNIQIERDPAGGLWWVINPRPLDVTSFCG